MYRDPDSQCCELSPALGWALVMQLSLGHFCSSVKLLTHIPVINPIKLTGSPGWTSVLSLLWSVVGFLSEVNRCVWCLPSNSLLHKGKEAQGRAGTDQSGDAGTAATAQQVQGSEGLQSHAVVI